MESWTVYILLCNDDTYYVGCSKNFEERLLRHQKGYVHYTKSRLPVKTITKIVFYDKYKAFEFEKYLKSGSGRAFMNKTVTIGGILRIRRIPPARLLALTLNWSTGSILNASALSDSTKELPNSIKSL